MGWDDEAEISFPEIPRMEDIPTFTINLSEM